MNGLALHGPINRTSAERAQFFMRRRCKGDCSTFFKVRRSSYHLCTPEWHVQTTFKRPPYAFSEAMELFASYHRSLEVQCLQPIILHQALQLALTQPYLVLHSRMHVLSLLKPPPAQSRFHLSIAASSIQITKP